MSSKKASAKILVEKPTGLRIVAMEVENIKRVRFAAIKPEGDVIVVSGDNGSGKTSLMDSIAWALTGTSEIPSQPIRAGQRVGKVKVDLGDFVVTRHFTRVDEDRSAKGLTYISKLAVEGKNREQFRSPQELLNGFMGKFTFDPLAFVRMDPTDQFKAMRGLVKFDVDIDALEQEAKTYYEARRDYNRDLKGAQARLAAVPESAADLPAKPINTEALTAKLQNAANHNSVIEAAKSKKTRLQEDAKRNREQAKALKKQIEDLERRADSLDQEAVAVKIEELIDTANVSKQLSEALTTNGLIAKRDQRKGIEKDVTELEALYKEQDELYDAKKTAREKAIAEAKMPLEGLSIGDGEVLYSGLPFNQASNAEQIRVSVAMAIAANPKMRIMCIRDGSLLDKASMKLIHELAERENYQIWIERVGGDGKVGIVMEDGEASGEGVVEQK